MLASASQDRCAVEIASSIEGQTGSRHISSAYFWEAIEKTLPLAIGRGLELKDAAALSTEKAPECRAI